MGDRDDEQRPEDEVLAEESTEQANEAPDVEGHKWHMGETDKAADPAKAYKAY